MILVTKRFLGLPLALLLLISSWQSLRAQDYRLRALLGDEKVIKKPCGPYQDSLLPLLEKNFSFPLTPKIEPQLDRWERACGPVEPLLRTRLLYQHSMDSLLPPPAELLDYYGFYLQELAARQNAPRYFFTPEALSYWDYTIQGAQKLQQKAAKPSLTLGLLGAEDFHAARKYIWRSPPQNPTQKALRDTIRQLLFPRQFYSFGVHYQQFFRAAAQRLRPNPAFQIGLGIGWNPRQSLSLVFDFGPLNPRDEWRLSHEDSIYQNQGNYFLGLSLLLRQQIWASPWQEGSLLFGLGFQTMDTGVEVWPGPEAEEKTPLMLNSYRVSAGLEWALRFLGTRRLAWRIQYHLQDFNQGTTAVSDFKGNAATAGLVFFF